MFEVTTPSVNSRKYARLTDRPSLPFDEVDNKIRQTIIGLEHVDGDLWSNPEYNKNQFAHSIFQYPAMMVPEVQRQVVNTIFASSGRQNITSVFDPFMGSGTSLVSCMHYGINCFGQDINPLAVLFSKVRTSLTSLDVKTLTKKSLQLLAKIEIDLSDDVDINFKGIDKWFTRNVAIELARIRRAIKSEENVVFRRFFWANLAEVIRNCSNDRTSTFKLHARPVEETKIRIVSAIGEMEKQLNVSLKTHMEFRGFMMKKGRLSKNGYQGSVNIQYANSGYPILFDGYEKQFADLLITSPPYGDNHTTVTYGQYSFLQLQWIDFDDIHPGVDPECLQTTAEIDSRSVGGRRSMPDIDLKANRLSLMSRSFCQDLEQFRKLDKERFNKIVVFLDDLNRVIDNSMEVLKKNSYMVWTIGNRSVGPMRVRNVDYLREFLIYKNCTFVHSVTRHILNKRMAKKNNNTSLMNTEEILVLRKNY